MASPTLAEGRSPTVAEMAAASSSSRSSARKRANVSMSVAELKNILLPLHSCSRSYAEAPPLGDISTSSFAEWKSFEEELKQWHQLHSSDILLPRDGVLDTTSLLGALRLFLESWYAHTLLVSRPAIGIMELFVINREYLPGVRTVLMGVYGKQGMVRLANYMVANQVCLGLAVDDKGITFCKRTGSRLLVCRLKRVPYTALGFMLHLSMEEQSQQQQPPLVDLVYDSLPDSKGMLAEICSGFPPGQLKDPVKVVSRLQFLQWSRLEGGVTPIIPERIRCYIVRTKYEGRSVVLKLRDLSNHYEGLMKRGDWRSGVKETIKEVDVYMRLRKCQGSEVPRLLSYGFVGGGMFTFLMLSDERVGDVVMDNTSFNQLQYAAVARGGMNAVKALHARGLLYGRQFSANDLVLSTNANPPRDAKLVGFSQVKVCDPKDVGFGLETARETLSMNVIVELLRPKN